ncbi:hypothetical protein MnTg02_00271 [bacterium MnTg02]|nr:hypothetical protein MnTg02_00271 [bacterium MnTg02]
MTKRAGDDKGGWAMTKGPGDGNGCQETGDINAPLPIRPNPPNIASLPYAL